MASLSSIIEASRAALASITPQTLTPEDLLAATSTLKSISVDEAIHAYQADISPKENDPEQEGELFSKADSLNKQLSGLKNELDRVKDMQSALKIPQLDDLIHAGQQVLRPIYAFTASMND